MYVWDDIATCKGVKVTTNEMYRTVMSGEHLKTSLQNINTYYGGVAVEKTDRIHFCEYSCDCPTGIKGRF